MSAAACEQRQRLIEECGGYWGNHAQYPRTDWKYEVANDDILEGYWDWVIAKLADAEGSTSMRQ